MGMCFDLKVADKDTVRELKKVIGKKLIAVRMDESEYDLELFFEEYKVTVSMQDSENYGTNIFFDVEKQHGK